MRRWFLQLAALGLAFLLVGCGADWYSRDLDRDSIIEQVNASVEQVEGVVSSKSSFGDTSGGLGGVSWYIDVDTSVAKADLHSLDEPVLRAVTEVLAPIGRDASVGVYYKDKDGVWNSATVGSVHELAKRFGIKYGK